MSSDPLIPIALIAVLLYVLCGMVFSLAARLTPREIVWAVRGQDGSPMAELMDRNPAAVAAAAIVPWTALISVWPLVLLTTAIIKRAMRTGPVVGQTGAGPQKEPGPAH
ncbi:hypothetical protein [Streptomyces albidoflavus]|uniref:hypothetical protein n=1 Tax=Streptomyces albidoflavus TaxID=1886 RepID=UPI0034087FD8